MIKCEKCVDDSICDFCGWYSFNGDKNGVYLGNGYCNKFEKHSEPEWGSKCDKFVCTNTKEGKELRAKFSS